MRRLLLVIEVPKLVNHRVAIDLLVRSCRRPRLRETSYRVELWRRARYPLGLGYAIVYCHLRVVLLGSRSVKSLLLIIILWLSLIYHWTIID